MHHPLPQLLAWLRAEGAKLPLPDTCYPAMAPGDSGLACLQLLLDYGWW
jgi:hypothetical protein